MQLYYISNAHFKNINLFCLTYSDLVVTYKPSQLFCMVE